LKTFTLNTLHDHTVDGVVDAQTKADVAYAFQEAVVSTLVIKCRRALQQTGLSTLVIAGGVSANMALREALDDLVASRGARVYYPGLRYCTDNGAMIAYAGCQRLLAGQWDDLAIQARPRWPLEALAAV